jgi:asparagine synthase (glutamine-hydrolysing)
MCAIAGMICLTAACDRRDHLDIVRMISDQQSHRGPDDQGAAELGGAALASNRLSIIDLSRAGHMPMSDPDGRAWIVYNGETYNFRALRDELIALGHRFNSKTDTEVVLQAFQEWGEASFDKFVGMFAFAIFDPGTRTTTLVRDRFGKKPLYYTVRDGHLLFASEVKALLRACGEPSLNYQRLIEWSLYRNTDFGSPETLIDNIFSLPPGQFLRVAGTVVEPPRSYYSPDQQVDPVLYERFSRLSRSAVTSEIESLVTSAVRERLVSDVQIGTLCSGGIDSSLVTALCARTLPDVTAFHVSVTGYEALDESRYARQVAEASGITLLTYPIGADAFRENLARAIYHSDFPLTHPNSVAFLLISEFARRHGAIILLSGEGADELFGGYLQRYRHFRQFRRAQRLLATFPRKVRKALAFAGYASEGIPVTSFSEYEGLLAHTTAFLDKFAREDLRLRCEEAYAFVTNPAERAVLGAMLADITNFLTPLLRRLDRMSMAASVECRTPFLDHQLVRAVINLPLSYRLRGRTDKWVLKQIAAKYVPHNVVYRSKVGFPLPVKDYLAPLAQQEFFANGFALDFLGMHRRGFEDAITKWDQNVHGFFNLLALEIWGRLFVLHEPLDQVTERIMRCTRESAVRH